MNAATAALVIPRQPVVSGHLRSIGYDEATGTLDVELASTRVMRHFGVPADLHQQLIAAESVGLFYDLQIRRKFSAVDLEMLDHHEGSTAD